MAATKYQVFYRYANPNSNQLITNDPDNDYSQLFEFYTEDHRLFTGTDEEKLKTEEEMQKFIIDGNNTANDNYKMLFKFTGTKRINKGVWTEKSIGYVIKDSAKASLKEEEISRAVDGDYSGKYLLVEGDTIENGKIVAKANTQELKKAINANAANGQYFIDESEIKAYLQAQTNFSISNILYTDIVKIKAPGAPSGQYTNTALQYYSIDSVGLCVGEEAYSNTDDNMIEEIAYNKLNSWQHGGYVKGWSSSVPSGCYVDAYIDASCVETYEIPAHYETKVGYPYVIRDTYKRIEQSPWFLLSTHASLNSAIEKAKTIVSTLGLENIKIIKVVPTEQFVRVN